MSNRSTKRAVTVREQAWARLLIAPTGWLCLWVGGTQSRQCRPCARGDPEQGKRSAERSASTHGT
eukprot:1712992-Pleurochrysis_carterae.AAC.1